MIRIATEADAQAIADIFNENIDERGFAHCDLNRDCAEARAKSLANRDRRHPTFVHVDANKEIVGWCSLKPMSARPSWSDVSEISL
jgi:L-amino acid N-acyltransferase YncA